MFFTQKLAKLRIFILGGIDVHFDWSKQNVNTDGPQSDWPTYQKSAVCLLYLITPPAPPHPLALSFGSISFI